MGMGRSKEYKEDIMIENIYLEGRAGILFSEDKMQIPPSFPHLSGKVPLYTKVEANTR